MAYNILIVDDSATMRSIIKRTLGMAALDVGEYFEAGNGQEALQVLEREWIDVVLADINMPVMNGIELTQRMQASEALRGIPVVVVSTEASTTRIDELKAKGVKGYVHKPFTPEAIRDVITQVLGVCHAGNK